MYIRFLTKVLMLSQDISQTEDKKSQKQDLIYT